MPFSLSSHQVRNSPVNLIRTTDLLHLVIVDVPVALMLLCTQNVPVAAVKMKAVGVPTTISVGRVSATDVSTL